MPSRGSARDYAVMSEPPRNAGDRLPPFETAITRARQARYHACCEVGGALYGDRADFSILGNDCLRAYNAAGLEIDGAVHLTQRFVRHANIGIDAPLVACGRIATAEQTPKGRQLLYVFEVHGPDGAVAVTSEMGILEADAAALSARPPSRARATRPAEATEGLAPLARKQLTPERVMGYSQEVGNRIHFEPEFAQAIGYRAPIAQGQMSITWMVEALEATGAPERLELSARFLRPLFWDDSVEIRGSPGAGVPARLVSLNPAGRIACAGTARAAP